MAYRSTVRIPTEISLLPNFGCCVSRQVRNGTGGSGRLFGRGAGAGVEWAVTGLGRAGLLGADGQVDVASEGVAGLSGASSASRQLASGVLRGHLCVAAVYSSRLDDQLLGAGWLRQEYGHRSGRGEAVGEHAASVSLPSDAAAEFGRGRA